MEDDLEKKGFPFTFDDYEDHLPNLPNYFVIHDLCFDYATTRFPKHKIEKSINENENKIKKQDITDKKVIDLNPYFSTLFNIFICF